MTVSNRYFFHNRYYNIGVLRKINRLFRASHSQSICSIYINGLWFVVQSVKRTQLPSCRAAPVQLTGCAALASPRPAPCERSEHKIHLHHCYLTNLECSLTANQCLTYSSSLLFLCFCVKNGVAGVPYSRLYKATALDIGSPRLFFIKFEMETDSHTNKLE